MAEAAPGGRARSRPRERAGLEDDPADQGRVDGAPRLDAAAGGASIWRRGSRGLVVGELDGGGELDVEPPLLARDERLELARDLGELARRGPSRRGGGGSSARARRRRRGWRGAPPRSCGSSCGLPSSAPSSGTSSRPDEVRELLVTVGEAGPAPSPPRRARGRTCDATRPYSPASSFSRAEKSRSLSASSIRRRWSSPSSACRVTLLGGHEREVRDLGADLLERALRSRPRSARRVLEPALPVGLGLLPDPLAERVGDAARLGEDLLRLAAGLRDQRAVLLEQLAGLVARVLGLLDRLADPVAALVDRSSGSGRTRTAGGRRT